MKCTFKKFLLEREIQVHDNVSITKILDTKIWNSLYERIKSIVNGNDSDQEYRTLKSLAYKSLTTVPEMEEYLRSTFGDDLAASSEYKEENSKYKALLQKIASYVEQSNKWKSENSGAWFHFIRSGKRENSHKTTKWYGTLKDRKVDSIKVVSNILYEISKLQSEYEVQLKVPGSYGAFLLHADSVVIHFHDPNLKDEINKVMSKFSSSFSNRARLNRTDFGTDDKAFIDGSDSMIIAEKFTETVKKNINVFKKYFEQKDKKEISKIFLSILNTIMFKSTHR